MNGDLRNVQYKMELQLIIFVCWLYSAILKYDINKIQSREITIVSNLRPVLCQESRLNIWVCFER